MVVINKYTCFLGIGHALLTTQWSDILNCRTEDAKTKRQPC